jgi:hypothetical protein
MRKGGLFRRPPGVLNQLLVPARCVDITLQVMRSAGEREMVVYWAGIEIAGADMPTGMVATVVCPKILSGRAAFRLADGQMGRIAEWCARRRMWILAPVHTHPNDEPHSEVDECFPLSHRIGFLSLVIPFFAVHSVVSKPLWQVHERQEQGWAKVEAGERLGIIPDYWIPG